MGYPFGLRRVIPSMESRVLNARKDSQKCGTENQASEETEKKGS